MLSVKLDQSNQDLYQDYLHDESNFSVDSVKSIYWPKTETELSQVLSLATKNNLPITISGARTGVVGGAVPNPKGIVISMNHFDSISPAKFNQLKESWSMKVGAAVTLNQISDFLHANHPDLEYLPDPTEMSASIGGTVATNASGARSFKYGATRNFIERIRVALVDGSVLDIRRGETFCNAANQFHINGIEITMPTYKMPQTKHCAGYFYQKDMDLIDLFIGSEGTLGIIIEVDLKLQLKAKNSLALLMFLPDYHQTFSLVDALRQKRTELNLEALEYFDLKTLEMLRKEQQAGNLSIPTIPVAESAIYLDLIYEEEDFDQIYEELALILEQAGASVEDCWAGTNEEEIQQLKNFRHAVPETINRKIAQIKKNFPALHKISTDFAVPDCYLEETLNFYLKNLKTNKLEYIIFGHIGDNHLHVNIIPKNPSELVQAKALYLQFAKKAVACHGTVSAEHGIGKIKLHLLPLLFNSDEIAQMKIVKHSLDPKKILSAGNLFD